MRDDRGRDVDGLAFVDEAAVLLSAEGAGVVFLNVGTLTFDHFLMQRRQKVCEQLSRELWVRGRGTLALRSRQMVHLAGGLLEPAFYFINNNY